MEQLKIDFQRLVGPNRIIDGKSFRLERSNNEVHSYQRYLYYICESFSEVFRQYVAVDENGIVGAINEVQSIARFGGVDGYKRKIITNFKYSLCGADRVMPYEPEVSVKKRTRKP